MRIPGHVIADRYRLVELLAGAGMATVWRADQMTEALRVALGVPAPPIAAREGGVGKSTRISGEELAPTVQARRNASPGRRTRRRPMERRA